MKQTLHCYLRVSSKVQLDGASIETQEEAGRALANQNGFDVRLWTEGAASASSEDINDRPVLMNLLGEVRSGTVKHIFVIDHSRLSRNTLHSQMCFKEFKKWGVTLHTKQGKTDAGNIEDEFMFNILGAVHSYENQQRGWKSRMGKIRRVKEGRWHGGPTPYGYASSEDKRLVINEDEAKWVRDAFRMYADGSTTTAIRAHFMRNGVVPRRGGKAFSLGSIQKMLSNPHYNGEYTYTDHKGDGQTYTVKCPRIVKAFIYAATQKKRKRWSERRKQINRTKKFYLLRNLMRCGHCERPMSATWKEHKDPSRGSNTTYYCPAKQREWAKNPNIDDDQKWKRNRCDCSMRRSLNIPKTDELVWSQVVATIRNSHLIKELAKTAILEAGETQKLPLEQQITRMKRRITALEKEIKGHKASIANVYTDLHSAKPGMTQEIAEMIAENIQATLEEAKLKRENLILEQHQIDNKAAWIDWWAEFQTACGNLETYTDEEKRELLDELVSEIRVYLTDEGEHRLTINFKVPIVRDTLTYADPSQKNLGYAVQKGSGSLHLGITKTSNGRVWKPRTLTKLLHRNGLG